MNEVADDRVTDDPAIAEDERECNRHARMARSLAELVQLAVLPVTAVLVVMRGPGVPTGVIVGRPTPLSDELDPVVLAEILAVAHDDRVVATVARLVLGDGGPIELAVARDQSGAVQGVIVARVAGCVAQSWLRHVLSRAAACLAAWQSTLAPWPGAR